MAEQTDNIHPLKNTNEKQSKIPFQSTKKSKLLTETESTIIKTEIKTEIKIEAPDYGDQSVWNSVKAPENIDDEISTKEMDTKKNTYENENSNDSKIDFESQN